MTESMGRIGHRWRIDAYGSRNHEECCTRREFQHSMIAIPGLHGGVATTSDKGWADRLKASYPLPPLPQALITNITV